MVSVVGCNFLDMGNHLGGRLRLRQIKTKKKTSPLEVRHSHKSMRKDSEEKGSVQKTNY